jgi:formylglycine-generating enzyme required for sulfatase activity
MENPMESLINMNRDRKLVFIIIVLLFLIVGCSQSEQTATSVLLANAVETPTGYPSPTPTSVGPTPTATAKAYFLGDSMIRAADEMVMVYVPAGTFQMGSSQDQIESAISMCEQYPNQWKKCERDWFEVESPQFSANIDGFWIDSTEVTNSHYERCVEAGGCKSSRLANNPAYNGANYPVAGVPWQDAADYCDWVGGRLPTEAEWEYAARGTQATIFPWGDEFQCEGGNLYDPDTGCDDGFSDSAPVGSFPAGVSWCGAFDLTGNVWEWVADQFGEYPSSTKTAENPSNSTAKHILRGGSWGYPPAFSRSAYRLSSPRKPTILR